MCFHQAGFIDSGIMAALLLNVCGNLAENKTADDGEISRPQSKFAVTYAGVYAVGTGTPPSINLGSGNDGPKASVFVKIAIRG